MRFVALLAVLMLGCASRPSTASVKPTTEVRPEPAAPAPRKLQLSAPLTDWNVLETSGFTVRFPPAWKMVFNTKVDAWACTGGEHVCMFRWGTAKFGADQLTGFLSTRKSTIKVMTTTITGDDAVLWAEHDEDGDGWLNIMRFHDGTVYHLAYMSVDKTPDDFFVVLPTMQFKYGPSGGSL